VARRIILAQLGEDSTELVALRCGFGVPQATDFLLSYPKRSEGRKARLEALPDVPAIGEFVAGYEASGWNGIAAPANTPPEIVGKLNNEINASFADPKVQARLADLGAPVFRGTPSDFREFITKETERWGKVIRNANIKAQ
jgi:tripartite-type tricarboxylate transporter receptor subunit TctC